MKKFMLGLFGLIMASAAQAQNNFLADDGTFKLPFGVVAAPPAAAGEVLNSTGLATATWTAFVTFGQNGGAGGGFQLNGSTSSHSSIFALGTGGTLEITSGQSANATPLYVADSASGSSVILEIQNQSNSTNASAGIQVFTGLANTNVFFEVIQTSASAAQAEIFLSSAVTGGFVLTVGSNNVAAFNTTGGLTLGGSGNAGTLVLNGGGVVAAGSPPTLTGTCTTSTQVGGNTAGSFHATCTAQTVIMTFGTSASNGWACDTSDQTTVADKLDQTASTTTSATFTGTTAAADTISFKCMGY